jgi:hypothetical protein
MFVYHLFTGILSMHFVQLLSPEEKYIVGDNILLITKRLANCYITHKRIHSGVKPTIASGASSFAHEANPVIASEANPVIASEAKQSKRQHQLQHKIIQQDHDHIHRNCCFHKLWIWLLLTCISHAKGLLST